MTTVAFHNRHLSRALPPISTSRRVKEPVPSLVVAAMAHTYSVRTYSIL